MSFKKIALTCFLVVVFVTLSVQNVRAAQISKSSAKQVVIDKIDDSNIEVGSRFTVVKGGANIGLVEIAKLNKDKTKAIGNILQGRAEVGAMLNPEADGSMATGSSPKKSGIGPKTQTWGFLGGLNMNTMNVKDKADTKGTSFNLMGFFEYPFFNWIGIRFWGGLQTLSSTGKASTAVCDGSTTCDINVNYLSLGGVAKWTYTTRPYKLWLGANYEYQIPLSKKSSMFDSSDIKNNYTFGVSTGADFPLSMNSFIPVHLEYAILYSNADIKASQIILKAGYGMKF